METKPVDISTGLEVYGTDTEKIGTITRVWTNVSDAATDILSDGYIQVDHGGILGIGATHLYVPFSAICDVVPGRCVTIDCANEECASRFESKPDFLEGD